MISHKYKKSISCRDSLESFSDLPFSSMFDFYSAGDNLISPSVSVKDLGILVDNKLSWDDHIFSLCKHGKRLVAWILNVFYARDKLTMTTLFNSLVRCKLEYCCQIWDPSTIQQIDAIEQLQRSFTRRIIGMNELNYWDRLKKLNIFSLQRRREKLIIVYIWKIKNHLVPNDIEFRFVSNDRRSCNLAHVKSMPDVGGRLLTL